MSSHLTKKQKADFESQIPFIQEQIARRKGKWKLTTLEFEDASQMLILHVFNKFHMFDSEKGKFEHWLNRILTYQIINLLRDYCFKFNRPCIQPPGCAHNLGNGACSYTASGKQCGECKLYRNWQKSKESQYNIQSSVTIENHQREVSNMTGDFIDIEAAKTIVDTKIMERLTVNESRMYKMLFINHLTSLDTAISLGYVIDASNVSLDGKLKSNSVAYQVISRFNKKVKDMAKEIIEQEDLA